MRSVSKQIVAPDSKTEDIKVKEIFNTNMLNELIDLMKTKTDWIGIDETKARYEQDFSERKIFSQFLTDPILGKKRLISMTDRITNTLQLAGSGSSSNSNNVATRPTVINCYDGMDLGSIEQWWPKWKKFMFNTIFSIEKHGSIKDVAIPEMIQPILKSKYPSITTEEEKISKPLQVLCASIFDAILIHMMNKLSPKRWQPMRQDICDKLNRNKFIRTAEILETSYSRSDIIFLQEVAGNFDIKVKNRPLNQKFFDIIGSDIAPTDRDQNSYILLQKNKFININEITKDIMIVLNEQANINKKSVPVSPGDLLVITANGKDNNIKYVLASFHGDTNGLATIPVVNAVNEYIKKHLSLDYKLLFGMDANTYTIPDSDQQGVISFAEHYRSLGLNSCWGQTPDPINFTTFHARTHLQSQLNKAVSIEEKNTKGDKNPKDFILFQENDFILLQTTKDNTGARNYIENMVFPTLDFPSDHGITSTIMLDKPKVLPSVNLRGVDGAQAAVQ
jgi:hypothetical protein